MIWLGEKRGALTDWTTQCWVRATGRRVELVEQPWLAGPTGSPRGIGPDYFERLAEEEGLELVSEGSPRGLLPRFEELAGGAFDPAAVQPEVARFYEATSEHALDAWGEWCGVFRPFGSLLARLFSRRLKQLNVPLSALDVSRGMTSRVLQLVDPASGELRHVAWVRELVATRQVVYVGSYSTCRVPGHDGPCVKVVFPLPNGNAVIIMKPSVREDGSLVLRSSGRRFGDPGFYFTVHHGDGRVWARMVRTMRETIHVHRDPDGARADHLLAVWGLVFLRLHYRLTWDARTAESALPVADGS